MPPAPWFCRQWLRCRASRDNEKRRGIPHDGRPEQATIDESDDSSGVLRERPIAPWSGWENLYGARRVRVPHVRAPRRCVEERLLFPCRASIAWARPGLNTQQVGGVTVDCPLANNRIGRDRSRVVVEAPIRAKRSKWS